MYHFKRKIIMCIVVMCLLMVGCGEDETADNSLKVYYLDADKEKLVAEDYVPKAKESDLTALITELIRALEKNGEKDRLTNPIEPEIEFDEFKIKENQLSIYFSGAYNNKTGLYEVLTRAAIVKTMCQLDGIDKVDFYVEDQPLMVEGESIGQMDISTFVTDLGNQGGPQSRVVKLYFSDASGQRLVPVDTEVTYPAAEKIADILVDCLIVGPEKVSGDDAGNLLSTIPTGTVLNNVTIRDNICYLDFSREFLELLPNVTSDVTVYSIVDTLCELPNVSRVQFTINSGVRERYGETNGFNKTLDRNLDIILKSE
ncbi:MAG: GerMN domain-containing protein [Eubacterium sp.]|nr:GerMN domain-containing protein [Eubacterium sp.]